jgi:acetolactate synthase-1/2/3 large subunit
MAKEKITGAMAVRRAFEAEGVEFLFGIPGGTILPLYDALFRSEKPKPILVRHEQVAGHAAEGFAHATGKVGVCMATSGPGATNLVTAIADAYMDSVPLVAVTANVARPLIGTDAFQEADITGITMPITKHNWLVTEPEDIPRIMKEAFYVARTGRPGPVLVDIPKDVLNAEIEWDGYPETVDIPGYHPPVREEPRLKDAALVIRSSTRPVIYLGGGVRVSNAHKEVFAFCELVGAPVVTTVHGKGAFPETNERCLGMFGMHGSRYANYTVQNSDLIVALGARFDDRVTGKLSTFAPEAKVVHLDIDPAEISKLVTATIPLVGDLKRLLPQLTEEVRRAFEHGRPDLSAWWKRVDEWRTKHPLRYQQEGQKYLLPQYVVDRLWQKTGGKAIVTTGVGEHQMFAAQWWKTSEPRQFITSGGLGTMGFCLPSAIGIQLGRPGELVIGIDGDGSFQMTLQDLATAVDLKLPIKIFILNNLFLGMVRQWQELFYDRRFSETPLTDRPNLVKLADAYGCLGLRADTPEELDQAIDKALANSDGPTIVDVRVRRQEKVYPMVPAGAPLNDMIDAGGD